MLRRADGYGLLCISQSGDREYRVTTFHLQWTALDAKDFANKHCDGLHIVVPLYNGENRELDTPPL